MSKDYYKILGVEKTALPDEIKKAYRKLANKHHPDKGGDENEFKDISEAYEILSNPDKKQQYDMGGQGGFNGFNLNDLFGQFGDIFSNFNGHHRGGVRKGQSLKVKVVVSLTDIINGCTKKLKYKKHAMCNTCHGKGGENVVNCVMCNGSGVSKVIRQTQFGRIEQNSVCSACNGSGTMVKDKCKTCYGNGSVEMEETIDVNLPAGVIHGMEMQMPSKGSFVRDGVPGDLFILIEETPDVKFVRSEYDLHTDVWISIYDAIFGTHIDLNTPHGNIPITVIAGCESGRTFKFSGKGIPKLGPDGRNHGIGDLLVKINVKIPRTITSEEREIISKLKDSKNFNIN